MGSVAAKRSPKLAEVGTMDELALYVAAALQDKAGKENAGFVEITVRGRQKDEFPTVRVKSPRLRARYVLTITAEAVS